MLIAARVLATVSLIGASTFGVANATNAEHTQQIAHTTFHSSVSTATAGVPIR
jgi:uncharacterized protein (UPF0212 family)